MFFRNIKNVGLLGTKHLSLLSETGNSMSLDGGRGPKSTQFFCSIYKKCYEENINNTVLTHQCSSETNLALHNVCIVAYVIHDVDEPVIFSLQHVLQFVTTIKFH